ncbi:sigma-70 family RNA polymerase sigma factor [Paenibacillus wynnii]|uniref:sigma-70 family RNA polymerase sigma factor n=1 Tax=Paenibacillus wynnii TaxID=268407 RepID=UPI002792C779|nr:sigma-70 family RNA polymerase sigma factor [Paenibacillus wynnii]MDQ0195031.1 RNA polymerase sigma-70 factor (ECF subfamily) [Paenibacillus wynnii]
MGVVKILRLIDKARKGNDKAFIKLFQQYEADIFRTAFMYVKNQNDALDVVQETAYRSFKSIGNLNEPKYFKTWLIKIAISCALDMLRKQKKVVQMKPSVMELISEDVKEDIDLEVTLQELIELLDDDEKSVIVLRFYHDMTIKEVAGCLDIPLGTAKTILYRTLKRLRKELKGDDVYGQ